MSQYGGTVTTAGRNMLATLIGGETLEFTRVVIGSGLIPDDKNIEDMTELSSYVADAVMSVPVVSDNEIYFIVEYRNDLHPEIQSVVWVNEIGVYARTSANEEVLLYYATLGDTPQPVNPFKDNRVDIRRYPISLIMTLGKDVVIDYNADSFITAGDADEIIENRIATFTHEFFHIGNVKPTVVPAFWFDTSSEDDNVEMVLHLADEDTPVSVVMDEAERGVKNVSEPTSDETAEIKIN